MAAYQVKIEESSEKAAQYVATRVKDCLCQAVEERGVAAVVLGGGFTFLPVYRLLAQLETCEGLDWTRVHLFFGDERCVPPEDERSNFGQVERAWLNLFQHKENAPVIHRFQGELSPDIARTRYEEEVSQYLGSNGKFDLVLLGVGKDGHTASLFPQSLPQLKNASRLVAITAADVVPLVPRLTLTPAALIQTHSLLALVTGTEKREVACKLRESKFIEYPAIYIFSQYGDRAEVVLDRAAAGEELA